MCAHTHVEVGRQLVKSALSFHVGCQDQTQVVLALLSHLASLKTQLSRNYTFPTTGQHRLPIYGIPADRPSGTFPALQRPG